MWVQFDAALLTKGCSNKNNQEEKIFHFRLSKNHWYKVPKKSAEKQAADRIAFFFFINQVRGD